MKKNLKAQAEIRSMLLENKTVKAIASDLDRNTSEIYRIIPYLGIRQVWVTEGEWKALRDVRDIVGPLK